MKFKTLFKCLGGLVVSSGLIPVGINFTSHSQTRNVKTFAQENVEKHSDKNHQKSSDGSPWLITKDGELSFNPAGWQDPNIGIPTVVNGIEVKSLAKHFLRGYKLGSVWFNEWSQIKRIPQGCFENSTLIGVRLPKGLTAIDDHAFANCEYLREINLAEGTPKLEYVGESAFENCLSLRTAAIPHTVTFVGNNIFKGTNNLTFYTSWSPEEINHIIFLYQTEYAYDPKTPYTADLFPRSKNCRLKAKNFRSYNQDSLIEKYSDLFANCLDEFQLLADENFCFYIDETGKIAPSNLYSWFGDVFIPEFVEGQLAWGLADYAFRDNHEITGVTFAYNSLLEVIGWSAFQDTLDLKINNLPVTLRHISSEAFSGSHNITITTDMNGDDLALLTLEGHGDEAPFYGNNSLNFNVSNRENAHDYLLQKYIEKFSGQGVKQLNVTVAPDIKWQMDESGNIRPYWETTKSDFAGDLVIPNDVDRKAVTGIVGEAFWDFDDLLSVKIPSSVLKIGERAFGECDKLTAVYTNWTVEQLNKLKVENQIFHSCKNKITIYAKNTDNLHHDELLAKYKELFANTGVEVSIEIDNDQAFEINDQGLVKAHHKQKLVGDIVIPNKVNNIAVNGIDVGGFESCVNITTLKLPDTLKTISVQAFEDCRSLNTVNMPSSVTRIDQYAFSSCYNLKEVNCNWNVTQVNQLNFSQDAFEGIKTLTLNVKNPNNFQHDALLNAYKQKFNTSTTGISNITINVEADRLIQIDNDGMVSVIDKTKLIGSIIIPNKINDIEVKGIKDRGFQDCDKLTSVAFDPESKLKTIGINAFLNCNNLTQVTIPSSVTTINANAFSNCNKLNKVNTSWTVGGLDNLTVASTVFVDNTQTIDLFAANPDYLHHDELLTKYQQKFNVADEFRLNIFVEPDQPFLISENGFVYPRNKIFVSGDITIPETINDKQVIGIANNAFDGCDELTSVTLPNTVKTIGENAFSNCSKLTSITLHEGLVTIGKSAFYNSGKLASITIPSTVETIAASAFSQCDGLTTFSFGDNSHLTKIADNTFSGCENLTSVNLPNSIKSIGVRAFENCNSLLSVEIPLDNVSEIGAYAFYNCKSLKSFTLPKQLKIINKGTFDNCNSLWWIDIPNSVTLIDDDAFNSCDFLSRVEFTEDSQLQTIGENAFKTCSSLRMFWLPKSVTLIKKYAFADCAKLNSFNVNWNFEDLNQGKIKISNDIFLNVPNIDINVRNQFNQYDKLLAKYQTLFAKTGANKVNYNIEENLFWVVDNNGYVRPSDKTQVHGDVVINDETTNRLITGVVDGAFNGCSDLTSITMPNTVTFIGDYAFANCKSLTTLNVNWTLDDLEHLVIENKIFNNDEKITINIENNVDNKETLSAKVSSIFTAEKTGAKEVHINVVQQDITQPINLGLILGSSFAGVLGLVGILIVTFYYYKKHNKAKWCMDEPTNSTPNA